MAPYMTFAPMDGAAPRMRRSAFRAAHRGGSPVNIVRSLADLVRVWRRRAYERRLLGQFGERERHDLALTPAEIGNEIAKPMWRA